VTEADILEQLVEFQNVLLFGVSIFVTLVSAYIVALYAFLDEAGIVLKVFACGFMTLVLVFLATFFWGSSQLQMGLVNALAAIEPQLSPAGQQALANARSGVDDGIRYVMGVIGLGFYVALVVLTFWNGWRKGSHIRVEKVRDQ
jgi:hypothetical protein